MKKIIVGGFVLFWIVSTLIAQSIPVNKTTEFEEGVYHLEIFNKELAEYILKSQAVQIDKNDGKTTITLNFKGKEVIIPIDLAKEAKPGLEDRFSIAYTRHGKEFDSILFHGKEMLDGGYDGTLVFHGQQIKIGSTDLVTLVSSYTLKKEVRRGDVPVK